MRIKTHLKQQCYSSLLALSLVTACITAQAQPLALAQSLESPKLPLTVIDKQRASVLKLENNYGPYDIRLKEAFKGLGFQLKNSGDFFEARNAYNRALHISRVNEGLYNVSQVSIVERLIELDFRLANWTDMNNHYGYLENLYKRLYRVDDPKLEEGLKKVVAWHIDASNINLDGNKIEHLRKVHTLFKLRLQVAELTLAGEDPMFDFLKQNIARSERYLYLASDLNKEMMRQRKRSLRDRYIVARD